MPKSCLPFHLFPSVIARVDGRPDIFIFGIGTDFLVQRWNFRLGFGPTTQASRVHFWWHWKWRKQKEGIKGYLLLFYHLSWSRTCTHATSALFLWHCHSVWKSLIKSHFTTLRAKRATIIFKYLNIKMRYFRRFSNTVMCYFWDCDKTIWQKLVRWRFRKYYFRLTVGNISWCTLEMISGTKFFHSGI